MDESLAGRLVAALARYVALAGGVALAAATAITVLSVIGRALIRFGFGAVPGDVELVQACVFFAVFAFLPWCQLTNGHAVVAIFTDRFPVRINALIVLIADLGMLGLAAFITWRHWAGTLDKLGNGEQTFILRIPLAWSYVSGLVGGIAFVIVAAYCVVRSGANLLSRTPRMPESGVVE